MKTKKIIYSLIMSPIITVILCFITPPTIKTHIGLTVKIYGFPIRFFTKYTLPTIKHPFPDFLLNPLGLLANIIIVFLVLYLLMSLVLLIKSKKQE